MSHGHISATRAVVFVCCGLFLTPRTFGAKGPEFNVASATQGAVAIADSEFGKYGADQAIDGRIFGPAGAPDGNRWHSAPGKSHPHWVWIRFRERARIEKVIIHRADLKDYPVDFVGEYSPDDGITFFPLFTVTNYKMSAEIFSIEQTFKPRVTDNFRLRILRSSHAEWPKSAQLSEIQVFGEFIGRNTAESHKRFLKDDRAEPILKPSTTADLEIARRDGQIEFRSKWLRVALSTNIPKITGLCWDSLGEGKVNENLLKSNSTGGVRLDQAGLFPSRVPSTSAKVDIDQNVVRYLEQLADATQVRWEIRVEPKAIRIATTFDVQKPHVVSEPAGVRFSFDPAITSVSALANPKPDCLAPLPLLLHAADYGTLLIQARRQTDDLRLIAIPAVRSADQWDALIQPNEIPRPLDGLYEIPAVPTQLNFDLTVEPCLPLPTIVRDEPRLRQLPRSWLNTFQYKADMGILANNPLSDNAALCMFTYTDPAVFTPSLPGGVEAINLARESLDQYFGGAPGYGVGREEAQTDTYPALLIAAWDVIRVTGDLELLKRWLPVLESIATKAVAQDRNGNGLPESTRSGLSGKFTGPAGNWWDQINFGHEDAYVCALSYRAFRCLADLERLAGRPQEAGRFEKRAELVKAAYIPNFLNRRTGIIAGWKDSKGELHDYWFIFINGLAITYGLVPDPLANSILDRFEAKFKEVGYKRFDLGLPGNLIPIAQADYGQVTLGTPKNADGSDTFGVFENGGATACYAYFYIQALYQQGRYAEAERILWPMVETFGKGGFQNGIGHGGEWRHWDGRPSGYEGFLADGYYAQMALFTGHYGIGFGPEGFHLESWSPLKGRNVSLGLKYMGKTANSIN